MNGNGERVALSDEQKQAVIAAVESVDWANATVELREIEQFLWHFMDIADSAHELGVERFGDLEAFLKPDEVEALDDESKDGYLAMLIGGVLTLYGVNNGRTLEARPGSLAELLRKVNDVIQLPVHINTEANR